MITSEEAFHTITIELHLQVSSFNCTIICKLIIFAINDYYYYYSKSPRYAKRSEESVTHRHKEPSKRASTVSVVVEIARGFNAETRCASERNASKREEMSESCSTNRQSGNEHDDNDNYYSVHE